MGRQYFVHYYRDFGNAYDLLYADTENELNLIPDEAEHITRKEAEALAAAENYRRKYDRNFSGYADNAIYPVTMNEEDKMHLANSDKYYKSGYVWERI